MISSIASVGAVVLGQLRWTSHSLQAFAPLFATFARPSFISSLSQTSTLGEPGAIKASEETLEEVRSRIFGTHIGNGLRSGRKFLRRNLLGPVFTSYYPDEMTKYDPLLPNLEADKAKLKLDRLKRRGKSPPKKGAGKRAGR